MTFNDLKEQFFNLRQQGPVNVEFVKAAADYLEAYPEGGMRATILDVQGDEPEVLILRVSYEAFDEYNKAYESHNYYDKTGNPTLTAREADCYTVNENLYVMGVDEIDRFFTLMGATASKLHEQYKAECGDKGITYVQWLEAKVLDC
jgi:hypothetical protein